MRIATAAKATSPCALREGRGLSLLVDPHETQVVLADLTGCVLALDGAIEEALQRAAPNAAPDREAHEALHRSGLGQPVVHLLVAGAAAEQHAHHAVAAAYPGLLGQHLRVRALVHALDLPDVHLDAEVLDVLDRAAHQLGSQLGVVAVLVAADRGELAVGGGHPQLEEELAISLVEPA